MKIYTKKKLGNFKFWGGAINNVMYLSRKQLDEIEEIIEKLYPHGIEKTTLNDLFWFDVDIIAEWLGYENFDEVICAIREEV